MRELPVARRPLTRALTPLLAAAALLTGCGGGSDDPATAADAPYTVAPGSLGGLKCADWNDAPERGKTAILEALREFAGGDVSTATEVVGTGATLADQQARDLFENRCAPEFARGFLLYKLYTHAAAFGGEPGVPVGPGSG